MEMNLNDFFVQLFESEKRAKQRKEQLSEIQKDITDTEIKITEAREEQINLKGQLAVKLQKLSEEEINLKWISKKESTMKMQLDELQKKISKQGSIKDKLKKSYNKKQEDFMVQAGEFVSNFGLSFNGKKIRETEASERLELLQKDEEILSKELQELRNKQRESYDIKEEKSAIMEEVRAYRKRLKDLEANLASAQTRTTEIYGEKQQLAKKPEIGQEFKRLQQELVVCRRDSLEGLCQALQLELNRLQRQVWQKRIQRPMVAVPPTSLQLPPPTGTPKFMPQRKCNTYARYGMTKPTASNCVLRQYPSDGSKVIESGELDSEQLIPPPGLSSNEDKFHSEATDQKTEIANIAEEAAFLEEIFISDDELTTADDAAGKRAASDNRLPQRAKRVRFQ